MHSLYRVTHEQCWYTVKRLSIESSVKLPRDIDRAKRNIVGGFVTPIYLTRGYMNTIGTIKIDYFILVFEVKDKRQIFTAKKLPSDLVVSIATHIFPPGEYPIPIKERDGMLMYKHSEFDENKFLADLKI